MSSELGQHLPRGSAWTELPDASRKYLELYYDYLFVEKDYSEHTLRAYLKDVLEFLEYMQRQERAVEETDLLELRSYFTMRTGAKFNGTAASSGGRAAKRTLSARSQARKLSAIRTFFQVLHSREIIPENPAADIPIPRRHKPLPGVIKNQDLNKILEAKPAADGASETGGIKEVLELRDRAIHEVLYSSGMRVAELLSLKTGMLGGETVKITGKGRRQRIVFLGPEARNALEAYLARRSELGPADDSVFLGHHGTPMTDRGVRYRMSELRRRLGMNRSLSPHKFRHTFATDLMNAGADIRAVQELLGHQALSTTQIYTSVTKERLRDIHRNCHPHARDEEDASESGPADLGGGKS